MSEESNNNNVIIYACPDDDDIEIISLQKLLDTFCSNCKNSDKIIAYQLLNILKSEYGKTYKIDEEYYELMMSDEDKYDELMDAIEYYMNIKGYKNAVVFENIPRHYDLNNIIFDVDNPRKLANDVINYVNETYYAMQEAYERHDKKMYKFFVSCYNLEKDVNVEECKKKAEQYLNPSYLH